MAVQPLPGVRPVCLLRHVQRQRRPVPGLRAVGERVPLVLPSLWCTAPRTGRLLLPRLPETTLYDFYRSRHRCCPVCGVAVTEVAVYCPECGARLPERREAAV